MLREFSGNAKPTTLTGAVSAAATSLSVADATGYPTGATGPFVITVDSGLASEEKVLCSTRTGNTLSVSSRGWDGTTAADHDNQAAVEHTYSATDAREANAHVNDTTGDPHPQYVTDAALTTALSTYVTDAEVASAVAAVVKTVRVPHTWAISGEVKVPAGDTDFILPFFLPEPAGQTVKIVGARYRINSGTSATVKLQLDGVDVTGFTALSVTTTATTTDPADVNVTDGQALALVVTAVSGTPKHLSFSVWLEYVV